MIFAVPGVPYEMQEMVAGTVIPELRRMAGDTGVIRSRTLRTWGHSESGIAEMLGDRLDHLDTTGHATIAFLASGIEGLKVRVTAKAPTEAEVEAVLEAEVEEVATILADYTFSTTTSRWRRSCSSCSASRGSHSARPSRSPEGSSPRASRRCPARATSSGASVVSYASEVKFDVLGVPEGPVVTEEAAAAMAEGACRVLGCDVAVATTGVAGPAEQEGLPAGTVFFATTVDGVTETSMIRLPFDRRTHPPVHGDHRALQPPPPAPRPLSRRPLGAAPTVLASGQVSAASVSEPSVSSRSDAEFMQKRSPVGPGPSGKT